MGGSLGHLLDLFFLARPVLVAVVWIFPLAGARGLAEDDPRLWLLLIQCAGLAGAAFAYNQVHDLAGDRLNRKCETLTRGLASGREARLVAALLAAGGLLAAWKLGRGHLLAGLAFGAIAGLGYNLPPLRAKDRPYLAPLLAGPAYALLILQGAALAGSAGLLLALPLVLPLVLAGLALSLLATVPDLAGDRTVGKRTWAVVHGAGATWRTALALMGAAALLALLGRDWQIALPAIASALFMTRGLARPEEAREALLVLRWSVAAQAMALLPSWPMISLGVALFLLAARPYYRWRFGVDYPALGS
ncbi:MAG: UbiA family prenyltransferase [bacterium]|jgi:4-hydroxybenzoate polyprenyltransferase|nr:UbiA family prenyltransferase [bacterium]